MNRNEAKACCRGSGLLGTLLMVVLVAIMIAVGWAVFTRLQEGGGAGGGRGGKMDAGPAPVAVVAIERGPIELRRVYSGVR